MRILAGADFHGVHEVYRWFVETAKSLRVDAIVLAGDLLGDPEGFETIELAQENDARRVVNELLAAGLPVLYIMGNDDLVGLETADEDLTALNGRSIELGRYRFVGYQYSLPFVGGVNEKSEEEIASDLVELEELLDPNTVFVTHSPARGILDPGFNGEEIGSTSLRELMARQEVRVHIHGHSHSGFGRLDRHFNVACAGQKRAMQIDLATLSHDIVEDRF